MPTYRTTIYMLEAPLPYVHPGPDTPGGRRAALNDAIQQLGFVREMGLHGIVVPDGDDLQATAIEFGPGQHNGVWTERQVKRERPAQAQAAAPQSRGKPT